MSETAFLFYFLFISHYDKSFMKKLMQDFEWNCIGEKICKNLDQTCAVKGALREEKENEKEK